MILTVFQIGGKMTTQANQLRVIPESETFSATTKYVGSKKVEAIFSLRRDAKSQRFEKKALFDFSNVTEEELYLLAMYACKVKLQALTDRFQFSAQLLLVFDCQSPGLEGIRHQLEHRGQTQLRF